MVILVTAVAIVICCVKRRRRSGHERLYDYPYSRAGQTDKFGDSSDDEKSLTPPRPPKPPRTRKSEAFAMKSRKPSPFDDEEHIYDRLHHKY